MRACISEQMKDNKGFAVILAIFLLVALTSVGLMAVRTSRTEIALSGNSSMAEKAYFNAEAGFLDTVGRLGANPNQLLSLTPSPLEPDPALLFESSTNDQYLKLSQTIFGSANASTFKGGFEVRVEQPVETEAPSGYSINQNSQSVRFCFKKVIVNSSGQLTIGDGKTVRRSLKGEAVVGPLECAQ